MQPTCHIVPTFFIEYRGWSQEINTFHTEFIQPGEKRFRAAGRHTPYDKQGTLVAYGDTAFEAVEELRCKLETSDYSEHYKSINDELLRLQGEVERLSPKAGPLIFGVPATVASTT